MEKKNGKKLAAKFIEKLPDENIRVRMAKIADKFFESSEFSALVEKPAQTASVDAMQLARRKASQIRDQLRQLEMDTSMPVDKKMRQIANLEKILEDMERVTPGTSTF